MEGEVTQRIAESVEIILNNLGEEKAISKFQDDTVADMMTENDLVYTDERLKIFSVSEKMYVIDYVNWHKNKSMRSRKKGCTPCVMRVFIWDIDAKQKRLYRPDEAWERLLLILEKKALDVDYAKNRWRH